MNSLDRWGVYELLKDKKQADIAEIEKMSAEEAKEGLIEFLLVRNKVLDGQV